MQKQAVVTSHFDGVADEYAAKYNGRTPDGHSFRIRERRVYDMFDQHGGKVLDIGCGPGIVTEWLLQQDCEVHGVDVAPQMIEICEQRFGNSAKAEFRVARVEKLPYEDGYFDSVIAMGLMEYLEDDRTALAEMNRVLRPGGNLIVTYPAAFSPWRNWTRFVYHPIATVFRAMIRRPSGYKIVHKSYREGPVDRSLMETGYKTDERIFYDFQLFPHPFDFLIGPVAAWSAARLEWLARSPLRWLATGFIVKATKV